MKKYPVLFLLVLLLTGFPAHGKYRQAAYITNIYFANTLSSEDGFVQPDKVFNKLKANDPSVSVYMVLNLLVDRGGHSISVDFLDKSGSKFDHLAFDEVKATNNNWTYTATGRFGGELPSGGVFFKIYDSHDGGTKQVIGTFRLMTDEW